MSAAGATGLVGNGVSPDRDAVLRAALCAEVARVDVVQVSADLARVVAHWLGEFAALAKRVRGCAPEGLAPVQLALAEDAVAAVVVEGRARPVALTPEVVRRTAFWLGRFLELAGESNCVVSADVRVVQWVLAEAAAAGPSRNRDALDGVGAGRIALGHDGSSGGVVSVRTAAGLLGAKPDTVRKWCRAGVLAADREGTRWFPKLAAVQEFRRRREQR